MENPFKIAFAASTGIVIAAIGITACFVVVNISKTSQASAMAKDNFSKIQFILGQNVCSALTQSEIESLNNARKEGPDAFRYTLAMIHYDRRGTWENKLRIAQQAFDSATEASKSERERDLKEAKDTLRAFSDAYAQIIGPDLPKK